MLSECYEDLVADTGERFSHVACDEVAPALPLSSASLDETADRLVVGDANGVVGAKHICVPTNLMLTVMGLRRRSAVLLRIRLSLGLLSGLLIRGAKIDAG